MRLRSSRWREAAGGNGRTLGSFERSSCSDGANACGVGRTTRANAGRKTCAPFDDGSGCASVSSASVDAPATIPLVQNHEGAIGTTLSLHARRPTCWIEGLPGILHRMVKRVLPLLVAVAVAGAPVALEACQVACASPIGHADMSHAAMTHATHHGALRCHDDAKVPGPRLSQLPHTCGHDGENQPPAPSVGATRSSTVVIPLGLTSGSSASIVGPPPELFIWPPLSRSLTIPTCLRSAVPLRI